jgi:hypothetical protein
LPDPNEEEQRISLYVPGFVLDLAEEQASRLGKGTLHEYCAELLIKAVEAERVREQVADVEAKRGPLEGLQEIAADPEYLAELSAASVPRDSFEPEQQLRDDRTEPIWFLEAHTEDSDAQETSRNVGSDGRTGDVEPIPPARQEEGQNCQARGPSALSPAAEVVLRHAGQSGGDPHAFLPSLRRGAPPAVAEVSELTRALLEIETECRSCSAIDRRLTFALHRLAFESQILHTDAWPGGFDVWTVDVLHGVQESVERILSGQDIRYYRDTTPLGFAAESGPENSP